MFSGDVLLKKKRQLVKILIFILLVSPYVTYLPIALSTVNAVMLRIPRPNKTIQSDPSKADCMMRTRQDTASAHVFEKYNRL